MAPLENGWVHEPIYSWSWAVESGALQRWKHMPNGTWYQRSQAPYACRCRPQISPSGNPLHWTNPLVWPLTVGRQLLQRGWACTQVAHLLLVGVPPPMARFLDFDSAKTKPSCQVLRTYLYWWCKDYYLTQDMVSARNQWITPFRWRKTLAVTDGTNNTSAKSAWVALYYLDLLEQQWRSKDVLQTFYTKLIAVAFVECSSTLRTPRCPALAETTDTSAVSSCCNNWTTATSGAYSTQKLQPASPAAPNGQQITKPETPAVPTENTSPTLSLRDKTKRSSIPLLQRNMEHLPKSVDQIFILVGTMVTLVMRRFTQHLMEN